MASNLQVKPQGAAIDQKTIEDFLFQNNINLNDKQKALFLRLSAEFQLNPFRREIYAVAYGNDFNIVTGYQIYLQRAEATGKLDGWACGANYSDGKLTGATIEIFRKDFSRPFQWCVALRDFMKKKHDGTPMGSWAKMPEFMIKKIAIGQGFRLAFPNELSGMPYLEEELDSTAAEPRSNQPAQLLSQNEQMYAQINTWVQSGAFDFTAVKKQIAAVAGVVKPFANLSIGEAEAVYNYFDGIVNHNDDWVDASTPTGEVLPDF